MSPASSSAASTGGGGNLVVAWDLDTTGRRLIDEICQIGAYAVIPAAANGSNSQNGEGDGQQQEGPSEGITFSQYVMPYRNPNPGARRSFGIEVVNVGRYRMLKDMATGKILKTKSEVSALQEFIEWLEQGRIKANKEGVILACHEVNRKFLVPLLLEAVHKYQLFDQFQATVKGFVNGVEVVDKMGSKEVITSNSLRSLCKTVLGDTNPDTNSASDRSKVLIQILAKVTSSSDEQVDMVDPSNMTSVTTSVQEEVAQLKDLKGMLDTQSSLRPIFEARLKQKKRSVRDRAMAVRKLVAESGLDFKAVQEAFSSGNTHADKEGEEESEHEEALKAVFKDKIPDATEEDIDDLAEICREYFSIGESNPRAAAAAASADTSKTPPATANGRKVEDNQEVTNSTSDETNAESTEQEEPAANSRPAGASRGGGRGAASNWHYSHKRPYNQGYHQGGRGGYHHNNYNSNQNYYHRNTRGGYHHHSQQQHYQSKPRGSYRGGSYRGGRGGGGRGGGASAAQAQEKVHLNSWGSFDEGVFSQSISSLDTECA